MEVEQPRFEAVLIWGADMEGIDLIHYTTLPAQYYFSYLSTINIDTHQLDKVLDTCGDVTLEYEFQ